MNSNSEFKQHEEENLLKIIIESGNYSDNLTLQRYYYNLLSYEQNPVEFTELLFGIILNSSLAESKFKHLNENEQKCFIIYFKNWLSKLQNLEDAANIRNLELKTISLIKLFLFDTNLFFLSAKTFFVEILKTLFSTMSMYSDTHTMKNFYNYIKTEIKTCLININLNLTSTNFLNFDYNKLKDFLIVIEALASSEAQLSKTTSELSDYFEILNFLLDFLNMKNLSLEENFNFNYFKNDSDKLNFLNSLVTTFCKISSKFVNDTFKKEEMLKYVNSSLLNPNNVPNSENLLKEEFSSTDFTSFKNITNFNQPFFNTEIFSQIIKKILILNSELNFENLSDEEINKNLIILENLDPNKIHPLSDLIELTLIKSHVIDLISNISDYLNINNIFENFENFKNLTNILTIQIIKSLSAFYKNPSAKIQEKWENSKEEIMIIKCMVRLLEFLINIVQNSVGANIFSENKLEIFRYIILPNLKTTELERELFLIEPEEFMNTLYDMSSKQLAKSPKVKSLKLIDIMCEYIDSFLKFVTEFYTDLIKYLIYKNKPFDTETNLNQIFSVIHNPTVQAVYSDYISTLSEEEMLEQSLQVLASISYLIYDRANIRNFFEDNIDQVNHVLIEVKDEFIKAKLCNFYAFTLDDMFHDNNQVFSKSFDDAMNFLMNCTLDENKNISLNFVALDSINSIIFDESMKVIVTDFVKINVKPILSLVNKSYFNNLTSNPLYFKTVKNLIGLFFNDIEAELFYIFHFFWVGIQKHLEEIIINNKKSEMTGKFVKFVNPSLPEGSEENVLKEKSYKLLDKFHSLISLINTCIQRCHIVENKTLIFNEILKLLQYLDSFVNNEYEEEIIDLLQIVLNDLKLVPNVYVNALFPILDKFILSGGKKCKFEEYHIQFIFNFMRNLREENLLNYKEKIRNVITNRLSIPPINQYEVCKSEKENLLMINFLIVYIIFYWDYLTLNEIYDDKSNDDCNSIINLLKIRLTKRSIVNEELITRILLTYYLVIIKVESVSVAENFNLKIRNFNHLEIFILKSISFSGRGESAEENSISSIFASKMILFLVRNNPKIISQFTDIYKDNTIINYIKHLINFNIDHLLFLKKEATIFAQKKEKDFFQSKIETNLLTETFYTNELNFDEDNNYRNKLKKENMKTLIKDFSNKRKKIKNLNLNRESESKKFKSRKNRKLKEFEFELDEISQDDSDDEDVGNSSLSNYGDDEDLVDEILNEDDNLSEDEEFVDENEDDRDEEFLRVKKTEKKEIHNFVENFSSMSFKNLILDTNEFKLFDYVMNFIQQTNPSFYGYILSSFSKTKLKVLESIRHFHKFSDKEGIPKFRKLVKIKRK